jgi:3-hydroxybutyryl-CoA dehydrogenase
MTVIPPDHLVNVSPEATTPRRRALRLLIPECNVSGIAEVTAQAGINVIMNDISPEMCQRGIDSIGRNLDRMIKRGRFKPEDRDRVLSMIRTTTKLEDLASADFVIEAVVENEDAKIALFQKLDKICPADVIFASNTSSISITRMGARTSRADRVIGMHFMNPVPAMKLVEIIRGLATSQDTYRVTRTLAERLGKTTMTAQDFPGFIVNRVLLPMINEAIYTLYEGVGGVTDIDTAMKLGTNQPMGPLELADLIGLDTCLAIMEVMHRVLGDDKYRPCPLLKKYVDAGYLGRKAGRGFYKYDAQGAPIPPASESA